MPQIQKPDFTYKWASGGLSVSPSNTKIQTGWTAEVPPFQWENWSQNRQDNAIAHIFQHGISMWDAATEYQYSSNGVKSLVMGSNGQIYRAKQINTNQNPVTDTTFVYWEAIGILPIASAAQSQNQTSNDVTLTPLRLADSFKGANQSFNTNGYQKLPGGLIIQWGTSTTINSSVTVNFPIAFPNACIFSSMTDEETVPSAVHYAGSSSKTTTSVIFTFNATNVAIFNWFALGY